MPKKKCDNMTGFRFELQDTERNMLELYTASAAVKNIGEGVGAILKPLADNAVALVGLIIAHEGFQFIEDKAAEWQARADANQEDYYRNNYERYLAITDDNPPLTLEEFANQSAEDAPLLSPSGWQKKVGDPIRKTLDFWGSLLSPF